MSSIPDRGRAEGPARSTSAACCAHCLSLLGRTRDRGTRTGAFDSPSVGREWKMEKKRIKNYFYFKSTVRHLVGLLPTRARKLRRTNAR